MDSTDYVSGDAQEGEEQEHKAKVTEQFKIDGDTRSELLIECVRMEVFITHLAKTANLSADFKLFVFSFYHSAGHPHVLLPPHPGPRKAAGLCVWFQSDFSIQSSRPLLISFCSVFIPDTISGNFSHSVF